MKTQIHLNGELMERMSVLQVCIAAPQIVIHLSGPLGAAY